jgi:hypothetical protein
MPWGGGPVRNQWVPAVAVISSVLLVVVLLGNGCSNNFKSINDTSSSSVIGGGGADNPDIVVIPGTKTAVLVDSNRVLSHLSACVGVAVPSDQTVQMYETKKSSISSTGSANTITAPMMMAIANIAGEVCNDLIEQEIALGRRIFVDVDFTANSLPTSPVLMDSIARLSLSCWQRQPTSTEVSMLMSMLDSVGSTEAQASRKSALMLCTAVLSSLDALLN